MAPLSGGDTTFTLPSYADVNSNYRTYANNVFGLLEAGRVDYRVPNFLKARNASCEYLAIYI
ncbi:MAG: hypothetical protein KF862_27790 [Chitinophagaceae bacterium]|nr:hypothetical protein [Chitinophagaceae bacterium]